MKKPVTLETITLNELLTGIFLPDPVSSVSPRWRVIDGDLISQEYDYCIDGDRLLETNDYPGYTIYDWPDHIAGKNWEDGSFFQMWTLAIALQEPVPEIDPDIFRATELLWEREMSKRPGYKPRPRVIGGPFAQNPPTLPDATTKPKE